MTPQVSLPIDIVPDAVLLVAADGIVEYANSHAANLFGYDTDGLPGRNIATLIFDRRREDQQGTTHDPEARQPDDGNYLSTGRRRNGEIFPIEIHRAPWSYNNRSVTIWTIRERPDPVRLAQPVQGEPYHRALIERLPFVVYQVNVPAERVLYVSPQLEDLIGYAPDEMQLDPYLWRSWVHPDDAGRVIAENREAVSAGRPVQQEFRLVARDGRVVWIRNEAVLVRDDQGNPVFWQGLWLDITDRKKLEVELAHLAYHDILTGLTNRAHFVASLTKSLETARQRNRHVAVIAIDLDNFKLVNDSLGHEAGDELLQMVAQRLHRTVREDDLLARFGGDEFAILLPDLPSGDAAIPALERIQSTLQEFVSVQGHDFYLNASLGLASTDVVPDQTPALLRAADMALYTAKRSGKGRYAVYTPAQESTIRQQLFVERDLRRGLASDEFTVHFQPIIDLSTDRLLAVEALLRWHHPTRGVVAPDEYITIAEERGLIVPLGRRAWQIASAQVAQWRRQWNDLPQFDLSMNVSPRELREPLLVTDLTNLLRANQLEPRRVRLEITEGLLLDQSVETLNTLNALKRLGVKLVIDDFGTGYSSLAYLKRFPLDILKIDRTFISDLGVNEADTALVRAIIAAGDALGLEVTAEGVETAEQAALLRKLGCHHGQGYYFGRPMSGIEFEKSLPNQLSVPRHIECRHTPRAS